MSSLRDLQQSLALRIEEVKQRDSLIDHLEQEDDAKFGRWANRGVSAAAGRAALAEKAAAAAAGASQ